MQRFEKMIHRDRDGKNGIFIGSEKEKEKIDHRNRFDQSVRNTINTAKAYYETNRKINIIIVLVGLTFLANSILWAWLNNGNGGIENHWLSVFSGGLSVASFVTLFFTKPQQNITTAFGNLAQTEMIYKAYCLQFDALLDYHLNQEESNLDSIINMSKVLRNLTSEAVMLVQEQVETTEAKLTIEKMDGAAVKERKILTTEKIDASGQVTQQNKVK
jgi:hypothetical protein